VQLDTSAPPVIALYRPEGQFWQLALSSVSNFPASHSSQLLSLVPPTSKRYFPSPQNLQLVLPNSSWNFPASQLVQAEAPVSAYEPVGQSVQEEVIELYIFPAEQAEQEFEPSAEASPSGQVTQSDKEVDPVFSLKVFSPQRLQLDRSSEPYFPVSQGVQTSLLDAPIEVLYFPSLHKTQSDS